MRAGLCHASGSAVMTLTKHGEKGAEFRSLLIVNVEPERRGVEDRTATPHSQLSLMRCDMIDTTCRIEKIPRGVPAWGLT